jgi:hypothetical protein
VNEIGSPSGSEAAAFAVSVAFVPGDVGVTLTEVIVGGAPPPDEEDSCQPRSGAEPR